MPSPFRPLAVVAAVGAGVMILGACSGGVSKADLEAQITSDLFTGIGAYPVVQCAGELPGEVDAMTTCSATYADTGETLDFDLTVTAVDRGTVNYRIEPAD